MADQQRIGLDEIIPHFEALEDPRSPINLQHPLVSVVVIALLAVLAGAGGPTAVARWALLKRVQPVWLQPSRDRKPLRYREEVLARRIGPGSEVRPRGHYSQSRLKGEAQGTYPDRCSTSPKRERSGVGPHERRSE
jgi:hypothetical protein